MRISLITAVSTNNVIGRGNELPWDMPADMRYFMQTTLGHHVIMGRKAYQDILTHSGKPLAGRTNIVVTRNPAYRTDGAFVVTSLKAALELAQRNGEAEAFIIGGEQIYRLGLEVADRIYLTRIHGEFEGDTHFPAVDAATWYETSRSDHRADAENSHPYSFMVLERV